MRAELIAEMIATGFSAGLGALLAQLAAALDALDKAPQNATERENAAGPPRGESETANRAASPLPAIDALRAVLADDNETIRLTLYSGAEALASVPLDPARAVALAAELCAAACQRPTNPISMSERST